jgi:hypothetical protein
VKPLTNTLNARILSMKHTSASQTSDLILMNPKMQQCLKALLCCATIGAVTMSAQAQNLLTDPGFESQISAPNPNSTGTPGWASFGGATFSTTYAYHGSYSLYTPGGVGGYSVPGTYQTFAATEGDVFTLSGYLYTPDTLVPDSNDFAQLKLSFFDGAPPNNYAGGNDLLDAAQNVGTPIGGGAQTINAGEWTFVTVTGTAPAGTASVGAYILDINADANSDFYFDNMSLTMSPVPEPTTMALAGMGGLGMLSLLRRRRKH